MRTFCVILLAAVLSACTPRETIQTISICPVLPRPARPEVPPIGEDELSCVSDATYEKILRRDRAKANYAEQLEFVIDSYNRSAEKMRDADLKPPQ